MLNNNPLLIFACAYHQEAIAIIEHFRLKKDNNLSQLSYYQNEKYALIETGAGGLNAACTTAYIAGKFNLSQSAWLNVGIAGHPNVALGDGLLCNKITDSNTLQNFYPDMSFKGSLSTEALISVNKPSLGYQRDSLYDMEAAGFYLSTTRFTTIEHIHSYKVVSDNKDRPADKFDKNQTRQLIQNRITDIEALAETLCESIQRYRELYAIPEEYKVYLQQLHLTVTQREQFKLLLRRWHALGMPSMIQIFAVDKYHNSKQFLNDLNTYINAASVNTKTDHPAIVNLGETD